MGADTMILALGVSSENGLAELVKENTAELYIIGDCAKPGKVGETVCSCFVTAWQL